MSHDDTDRMVTTDALMARYVEVLVELDEMRVERDNAIAAFNEQCARLDAIEKIVMGEDERNRVIDMPAKVAAVGGDPE